MNVQQYLSTLKTKDAKYKRVCLSPLRYAGGKSKAVGIILSHMPELKDKTIVSPFVGGGSFELCAAQQLGFKVIAYDVFELLVNFWATLKNDKQRLVAELKKLHVSKEDFATNRQILMHYWNKVKPDSLVYNQKKPVPLTSEQETLLDDNSLLQAVYYYYNMTLSYGPMFLGWPSSNEMKPEKYTRKLDKLSKVDLSNMSFATKTFDESIPLHNDDFLFVDPPYYLGGDSKMFKGMYPNCNFAIHHNDFDHQKLCELLKSHNGGFLLTYNNCEEIRKMYADYTMVFPEWQYTYGQGEMRIGKNRTSSNQNNIKESHEIIIIGQPKNYVNV